MKKVTVQSVHCTGKNGGLKATEQMDEMKTNHFKNGSAAQIWVNQQVAKIQSEYESRFVPIVIKVDGKSIEYPDWVESQF